MADPITLAAMGTWALSGPFQGLGDRMFCRATKAVQNAIGADDPRNHDLQNAVRRAQARAVRASLKAYLRLEHPSWRDNAGYSPDDLERKVSLFVRKGLEKLKRGAAVPEAQSAVESQIERVFTHPDPVDDRPAVERLQASRELAETWTLDELRGAVGDYPDWPRFELVFRDGDGGSPSWWRAFRAILAEEVKDEPRVAAILNQQALSKLLEQQIDIAIDLKAVLAEMREGLGRTIAYALRESQRNWHGVVNLDRGAEAVEDHERQIRERPTELVIARYRIVPYLDRGGALAELLDWARRSDGPPAAGRLYVAPGGLGKTRLTIETLRQLDLEDWRCTFLSQRNTRGIAAGALADLMRADDAEGVCLVLDYAEGQQTLLRQVCETAAALQEGRVRIIALARSPEGWWAGLRDDRDVATVFEAEPHRAVEDALGPGERDELFASAVSAFATELQRLGLSSPRGAPADLSGRAFDRPLTVAMAAFLSARGQFTTQLSVLEQMFREERKHWKRLLGVEDDNDPRLTRLHRLAAQLSLIQSATWDGALALAAADPVSASDDRIGREKIVAAAERLYGVGHEGVRWLRGVEPDLLGEHAAMRALGGDDGGTLAVASLGATLSGPPLRAEDAATVLEVLARTLRPEHDHETRSAGQGAIHAVEARVSSLDGPLVEALHQAVERAIRAIKERTDQIGAAPNDAFNPAAQPTWTPLSDLHAMVVERRGALARQAGTGEARIDLGDRLTTRARHVALSTVDKDEIRGTARAVERYEVLAQSDPAYFPHLAMSLSGLAKLFSEIGDLPGALKATRRAVEIYEHLAEANATDISS